MSTISITAEAASDILRRLASGELEVHGILLRETAGKQFRHILRGMENFPADAAEIPDLPLLDPLLAVLSVQQLLGVITVAQNAATAATLKRLEAKLNAMDRRLEGIEQRLIEIDANLKLVLAGTRGAPVSRLRAATNAASTALRKGDTTALIGMTKDAEQAARDLLAQACHLISVQQNGLPVALRNPQELADLATSAAEGMMTASAMHLALEAREAAAGIMHEVANTMAEIRLSLHQRLSAPELMLRRMDADLAPYAALAEAATRLRETQLWTRGRAVLIEAGYLGAEPGCAEFEAAARVDGIVFEAVGERPSDRHLRQ